MGTWWRYRTDKFGWTSGSTQLFEQKILGWAGPAFHYGALAAIGGHVIGLMIPKSFTEAIGMSESAYRWFSAIAGAIAAALFLQDFVNDVPWAHLDIAGPSFTSKDNGYTPRGATGFGVRTLVRYVMSF